MGHRICKVCSVPIAWTSVDGLCHTKQCAERGEANEKAWAAELVAIEAARLAREGVEGIVAHSNRADVDAFLAGGSKTDSNWVFLNHVRLPINARVRVFIVPDAALPVPQANGGTGA